MNSMDITASELRPPEAAAAPADASQTAPEASVAPSWHLPRVLQRGVRLASWLVLLVVGWGLLQLLALLVQTERIRASLQTAAEEARLPQATSESILRAALRELHWLSNPAPPVQILLDGIPLAIRSQYQNQVQFRTSPVRLLEAEKIELRATVDCDQLLPFWLGPQLPLLGQEQLTVRWEMELTDP